MRRLALAALILAATPVLAQTPEPETTGVLPEPEDVMLRLHYSCEDGAGFDAVFVNTAGGSGFAVVGLEGRLIPMAVEIAASGARYVSVADTPAVEPDPDAPRYQLWTKGMDATLSTLDGEAETPLLTGCTAE